MMRLFVSALAVAAITRAAAAWACSLPDDGSCKNLLPLPQDGMGHDQPGCADRICDVDQKCKYRHIDKDGDGHGFGPCVINQAYVFTDPATPADDCDDTDATSYPGTPNGGGRPSNWDGPQGAVAGVLEPFRCDGHDHNCNH